MGKRPHPAKGSETSSPPAAHTTPDVTKLPTASAIAVDVPAGTVIKSGLDPHSPEEILRQLVHPELTKPIPKARAPCHCRLHRQTLLEKHCMLLPVECRWHRRLPRIPRIRFQVQWMGLVPKQGVSPRPRHHQMRQSRAGAVGPGMGLPHDAQGRPPMIGPPTLWSPNAIGAWSFFLTWAFGALLVARNWKALGEAARARRAMVWFYGLFPLLILSLLASLLDPRTAKKQFCLHRHERSDLVGVVLTELRPHRNFIEMTYAGQYHPKPWAKPVVAWGGAWALLLLAIGGMLLAVDSLKTPAFRAGS